jgi:predicted 3-demethylubiquinone-9 3-methyltransferase (glyoxalase superfamily)
MAVSGVTPFLWYDDDLEEAIASYGRIFGPSELGDVRRYPNGRLFTASFEVAGQRVFAMNAGPGHPHTDAFSFFVDIEGGQAEVDRHWDAFLAEGATEVACSWLTDRFGVSWQIVPEELMAAQTDPDPERARYANDAMMKMKKIVIADLYPASAA